MSTFVRSVNRVLAHVLPQESAAACCPPDDHGECWYLTGSPCAVYGYGTLCACYYNCNCNDFCNCNESTDPCCL
jgi:hypothetical protein